MSDPGLGQKEEDAANSRWGFVGRAKFWLVSKLGYWIIRAIGITLRYEIQGWENYQALQEAKERIIYAFWHGRILTGTYFFRGRGIVVMTSRNKDGEYIARVIRRFGYGVARGSSSRGGRRALMEMMREMEKARDVAFALDGPRGPRYVAKSGAIWLAARTGAVVFPFHFSPARSWVLKSWDQFQIPKPFTRVLLLMAPAIHVRPEAGVEELGQAQHRLQSTMQDLLRRGDSHWTGREAK